MDLSPENVIKRLDWNLLKVFIVIVQEKSITKSGHRLLLTQPAVSSALKRLENTLGSQLINRDNRRITVTKAGQILYKECLHIQATIANIANILEDDDNQKFHGKVTIHMANHIQFSRLLQTVSQFQQSYPNVEVRFYKGTHDEVLYSVLNSTSSVGFVSQQVHIKQFCEHLAEQQNYGLFCGKKCPLFGQSNSTETSLKKQISYAYHEETMVGSLHPLMQYRVSQGLTQKIAIHTNSVYSMMELIQLGSGVGFLPQDMITSPDFWQIPLPENPQVSLYSIVNSRAKRNMAETALLKYLQDHNLALLD